MLETPNMRGSHLSFKESMPNYTEALGLFSRRSYFHCPFKLRMKFNLNLTKGDH